MQKATTSRKDKYKFFVYTEFYTKLYTEAVAEQILCLCGAVPSVRCFAFISDFLIRLCWILSCCFLWVTVCQRLVASLCRCSS